MARPLRHAALPRLVAGREHVELPSATASTPVIEVRVGCLASARPLPGKRSAADLAARLPRTSSESGQSAPSVSASTRSIGSETIAYELASNRSVGRAQIAVVIALGLVGPQKATARLDGTELEGKAVLIRTGWDARWGTDAYSEPGPFVSPEALELLLEARPNLVGVDFWNVDDTVGDPSRRVHTSLLGAGILVVEHLCNVGALPRRGFRLFAVPSRVVGGASFPVRVFAELGG